MESWKIKEGKTAKDRLESGYHVLQTILVYRTRTDSPGLGWGIERAIVDYELDELEEELRANPPVLDCRDQVRPMNRQMDPLPLPTLGPFLKHRLKPLMQPGDPASGRSDLSGA